MTAKEKSKTLERLAKDLATKLANQARKGLYGVDGEETYPIDNGILIFVEVNLTGSRKAKWGAYDEDIEYITGGEFKLSYSDTFSCYIAL